MPNRGILYLLANDKHAAVLVVSIWSLRKAGCFLPVHMAVADDKAQAVAERIARDPRLAPFTWARWEAPSGPRGSAYAAKTHMQSLSPFEETLFHDADTLVCGDVMPMFDFHVEAVTLTQFSTWVSNGRKITGRLKPWAELAPDDVKMNASRPLPAINTGVLSFDKSPEAGAFFEEWQSLTYKKIMFIVDELTCQLIFWRHSCRVLDSRYNSSPIHDKRTDAAIYHGHGFKFIKKEQGRRIWWPAYQEALTFNIASLGEWTPAGDKHLKKYLDSLEVQKAAS